MDHLKLSPVGNPVTAINFLAFAQVANWGIGGHKENFPRQSSHKGLYK